MPAGLVPCSTAITVAAGQLEEPDRLLHRDQLASIDQGTGQAAKLAVRGETRVIIDQPVKKS